MKVKYKDLLVKFEVAKKVMPGRLLKLAKNPDIKAELKI